MEETKIVVIDGIGVNATFFASLTKGDAVKEMVDGGVAPNKDAAWAAKAYDTCVKEVKQLPADVAKTN